MTLSECVRVCNGNAYYGVVLYRLQYWAGKRKGEVARSCSELENDTGLSERTVRRAMVWLRDTGLISYRIGPHPYRESTSAKAYIVTISDRDGSDGEAVCSEGLAALEAVCRGGQTASKAVSTIYKKEVNKEAPAMGKKEQGSESVSDVVKRLAKPKAPKPTDPPHVRMSRTWAKVMKQKYGVGALFTGFEIARVKHMRKSLVDEGGVSDEDMISAFEMVLRDWDDFAAWAKEEYGLFGLPERPNISKIAYNAAPMVSFFMRRKQKATKVTGMKKGAGDL